MNQLLALPELWEQLAQESRPIVLYGMGDGADKILTVCHQKGISIAGVFASDDFVRGQSFHQWKVGHLSDMEKELGEELVILLAFGTAHPAVLADIHRLARRHTLYAPDLPVTGDGLFHREFLVAHQEEFAAAHALLADHHSKQLFWELLAYKFTGQISYLERVVSREEMFQLFDFGVEEIFVDAGAFRGDTIEEFLRLTGGRYQQIYGLEPDTKNYNRLRRATARIPRCLVYNAAVWQEDETLYFQPRSGRSGRVAAGSPNTRGVPVDSLVEDFTATYINYDVEGAERPGLLGAAKTIAHSRPKLLVSVYHRPEDLFDLPLLVHQLHPGYDLYLRRNPGLPAWDINLLAIPGKG